MKKLTSMILIVSMLFTLAACGSKTPTEAPPSESSPVVESDSTTPSESPSANPVETVNASDLKVALLIPSAPTDGAWGQSGAEALKKVEEQFGCKVSIVEAPTADKMKSEAEALADDGYGIIFGHGGQYASPFLEVANDYPNTFFVTMGGLDVSSNVFPVHSTLEDATYIQGVIAAKISKTGKMGLVVGGSFPAYTKTSRSFELGVHSINPDAEVMTTILTNVDMNEAYESTMSQINAGADVIWANANQATYGSLKAAKEKNIYYFGCPSNMNADEPSVVIASVTQDFHKTYAAVVERYLNNTLKSEIQEVGFNEDAIGFVWNEELKSTLPEDVQNAFDEYSPKIISGELDIPGETE